MTHALIALIRGDVKQAMRFNRFVLLIAPLLLVGIIDATRRILPEIVNRVSGAANEYWKRN